MNDSRGLRWWPFGLILLVTTVSIGAIWLLGLGQQRQDRFLYTVLASFLATAATGLWWLLFSRAPGRLRLYSLLLLLIVGVLAFFTLRVDTVSGDLIPQFRWAWQQPADARLGSLEVGGGDSDRPAQSAHDFLGYFGTRGDGKIDGVQLAADWETQPPELLWRRDVGSGWSGFAVSGDYAITQEQRGETELTSAYDLRSGEPIWVHEEPVRHDDPLGGPGPRATPAIHNGIVYSIGGTGILNALDLRSGESLWRHEMETLAAASRPIYGYSASPVVRGDRVVVSIGAANNRSVWAFDPLTGEPVWNSGDAPAGYATPVYGRLGGVDQWIVFNDGSVNGYAADDGRRLWSTAWPQPTEEAAQPVILSDDRLLVSSGYGVGSRLYRISPQFQLDLIWESLRLKAKFADFIERDGYVYGLDDGILTCISVADGERVWKGGRYGHGQLLLVGDKLLIQTEPGAVVLVAADPHGHNELARLDVFERKAWNHPALAGEFLLVRTDREAAVFRLPLE